mmetsp:Transcript_53260/g.129376  ORF Transcript_53260/g.129376 Transcript_53260/m.129376 type:complete len:893 (-) Transcript_53260:1106-3784(-)
MTPPVVVEEAVNPMATSSTTSRQSSSSSRSGRGSSSAPSPPPPSPASNPAVGVHDENKHRPDPSIQRGTMNIDTNDNNVCDQQQDPEQQLKRQQQSHHHEQQQQKQDVDDMVAKSSTLSLQEQEQDHQQQQTKDHKQITDPSTVDVAVVKAVEPSSPTVDSSAAASDVTASDRKDDDNQERHDQPQPQSAPSTTTDERPSILDTSEASTATTTSTTKVVGDGNDATKQSSPSPKSQLPPRPKRAGGEETTAESSNKVKKEHVAADAAAAATAAMEERTNQTVVAVEHTIHPPGTSTQSMPSDPVTATTTDENDSAVLSSDDNNQPHNLELQRSRSETDASSPTVQVTSSTAEDLSNDLNEFLSSPTGSNQIAERSPGGRYLRFNEKLGSGASKDVYKAYDTQEGIEVAWNVVHLAGVPKQERNRIVNEVRLLERLHHQNIISFHGSWVNRERQQVNFVTEILSSGTLKSFVNRVQVIRWKIAKRWAVQILKGLEYLHSQEPPVIHRDLKCENIFINGTSGDLRIGDLGLSTVHRNGKVLSVLGTPEFMAPDMYDETPYDEKVDIYAFGMCLLEMFTKEIPYRECNNPAQIYKKVMRGAPPDCLKRLRSTHAKEFIELCLGYRDEDGKYVRPSATELLAHPFLEKRPVDDDEVEIDPPIREQAIGEGGESNENVVAEALTDTSPVMMSGKGGSPKVPVTSHQRQNSLEIDEKDGFDQMPDSEINSIRKVKVLMGRGEELKDDDADDKPTSDSGTKDAVTSSDRADDSALQKSKTSLSKVEESNGMSLHYLVAAAVLEEDNQQSNSQPHTQPYPDDVLKLVITLPVDGQTQNVQFDFHLVEDDAIQVAKEMVEELEIPNDAVLEVSETISGLARTARTKKYKFQASQQQQQQQQ